eukprot:270808_1
MTYIQNIFTILSILAIIKTQSSCDCPSNIQSVSYNNKCYATITGVPPHSTTVGCEGSWYTLPSGWQIAEAGWDTSYISEQYPWGAYVLIYGYPSTSGDRGDTWDRTSLSTSYCSDCFIVFKSPNQYGIDVSDGNCKIRILITHPCIPTLSPTTAAPTLPTLSPTLKPSISPTTAVPTLFPTTFEPTLSPTAFPGLHLMASGYNLFRDEIAGSHILDLSLMEEHNLKNTQTDAQTCEYQSLEFTSSYSTYYAFAEADAHKIGLNFGVEKYSAGGSLTQRRVETRAQSKQSLSEIYSMYLSCTIRTAGLVTADSLYWDEGFIKSFRALPMNYTTGDDLEVFSDFWNLYGTHIILNAGFGGYIQGAVVADSCEIETEFGDYTSFETCLNGAYKGVSGEYCNENDDPSYNSNTVSSSIKNTRITVKGGDSAQFTQIFNEFKDKSNDFQDWINELEYSPYVVSGTLNEIHDVITNAINIGQTHELNRNIPNIIYDDHTYLLIAEAMRTAYNDYALQLSNDDTIFADNDCKIECDKGSLDVLECSCINCGQSCCLGKESANSSQKTDIIPIFVISFWVWTMICGCL